MATLLHALWILTFSGLAMSTLQTDINDVKTSLSTASSEMDTAIAQAMLDCPACPDPCDSTCFITKMQSLKNEIDALVSMAEMLLTGSIDECAESLCRYMPPVTTSGNPGFAVSFDDNNTIKIYDSTGTELTTHNPGEFVRGMYYHPLQERLYMSTYKITSVLLNDTDQRTHGNSFAGTRMALTGDPYTNTLFLTTSPDAVWSYDIDGDLTRLVDTPDAEDSRALYIDTCSGTLYWADEDFDTIKSMNVEGNPNITTLVSPALNAYGMDVDIVDNKIYWCAKTTGRIYVFDLATSTNTQLVGNLDRGSCYNLRLYNDFIYTIHYRSSSIHKFNLDGTDAGTVLTNLLPASVAKHFTLIV